MTDSCHVGDRASIARSRREPRADDTRGGAGAWSFVNGRHRPADCMSRCSVLCSRASSQSQPGGDSDAAACAGGNPGRKRDRTFSAVWLTLGGRLSRPAERSRWYGVFRDTRLLISWSAVSGLVSWLAPWITDARRAQDCEICDVNGSMSSTTSQSATHRAISTVAVVIAEDMTRQRASYGSSVDRISGLSILSNDPPSLSPAAEGSAANRILGDLSVVRCTGEQTWSKITTSSPGSFRGAGCPVATLPELALNAASWGGCCGCGWGSGWVCSAGLRSESLSCSVSAAARRLSDRRSCHARTLTSLSACAGLAPGTSDTSNRSGSAPKLTDRAPRASMPTSGFTSAATTCARTGSRRPLTVQNASFVAVTSPHPTVQPTPNVGPNGRPFPVPWNSIPSSPWYAEDPYPQPGCRVRS
eukprot:gene22595-biopygen22925